MMNLIEKILTIAFLFQFLKEFGYYLFYKEFDVYCSMLLRFFFSIPSQILNFYAIFVLFVMNNRAIKGFYII